MILSKEKMHTILRSYYQENFGERDSDHWYEDPAANVWMFGRDGKIITLKCHVLTGEVEAKMHD